MEVKCPISAEEFLTPIEAVQNNKDTTMQAIRSFVVLDVETTGLRYCQPRITEIAMMAVSRENLIAASRCKNLFPRVYQSFNICVNPEKTIEKRAADITGLTNELLSDERTFDLGLFSLICNFLDRLPTPLCLVAHNGNGFDFAILQAELARIGQAFSEDILCADTLPALREHLPVGAISMPDDADFGRRPMEMLTSHRLPELYKFLIDRHEVRNLHSASVDVEVLMKVIASQGEFFPLWADHKAVPFTKIKKMW